MAPWFLDEFAHAGGEHLDAEYVAAYDRKAATDPSGDLAVLQGIGPQDARTLVDFGAGTCTFALAAAPSCRRVVAVDVSLAMLTVLQARAEELGIRNVERVWGGLLSYQHQGEPADFVYSRNALHHLPDSWKALAPHCVAAILRPDGVLRLREYDLTDQERRDLILPNFVWLIEGRLAGSSCPRTQDALALLRRCREVVPIRGPQLPAAPAPLLSSLDSAVGVQIAVRRHQIYEGLAIPRRVGVQVDQMGEALRHTGDHVAPVAVPDQRHVGEFLFGRCYRKAASKSSTSCPKRRMTAWTGPGRDRSIPKRSISSNGGRLPPDCSAASQRSTAGCPSVRMAAKTAKAQAIPAM